MKIAVICANGEAGKLIVKEALDRKLDMTAVVRGENKTEASQVITKDLFDLTVADLKDFDVVIDTFGAWTEDMLPLHSTSLKYLCDILSGTDTRLLVVGGAGGLYVNAEHTAQVMDGPGFPDAFRPLASNMSKALAKLRQHKDVRWTYINPVGNFQVEGEWTGNYLLGGEELTLNNRGESIISYADYTITMVDEAAKGNHDQQRISVVRAWTAALRKTRSIPPKEIIAVKRFISSALVLTLVASVLAGCSSSTASISDPGSAPESNTPSSQVESNAQTEQTNTEEALALIGTFVSGDAETACELPDESYIQHNLAYDTGEDAFISSVEYLTSVDVKTIVENTRPFEDGDYVFLQTAYNFASVGEQVAFNIFCFDEDGETAEH